MRFNMLQTASMAGLALLAGCAYPNPRHVAELKTMVGKSEADLVRAQGVPSKTYETGSAKFLSYRMNRIDVIGDGGFYPGFGDGGFGYGGGYGGFGGGYGGFGYGGGFGPDITQRDCDTTFELKAGIVQSWSLRGNDC